MEELTKQGQEQFSQAHALSLDNLPGVWWAETQSPFSPSAMYFMPFTFQIYVQECS